MFFQAISEGPLDRFDDAVWQFGENLDVATEFLAEGRRSFLFFVHCDIARKHLEQLSNFGTDSGYLLPTVMSNRMRWQEFETRLGWRNRYALRCHERWLAAKSSTAKRFWRRLRTLLSGE